MNSIERFIYEWVREHQGLKRVIRDTYQRIGDLRRGPALVSAGAIVNRPGYFFGFHDKSPFSASNTYLLAHQAMIPLRMPEPDDPTTIGFFSGESWLEFRAVAVSKAWNWHQGAMLQWLGKEAYFVFNDFDGKGHVARVYNLSGRCEDVLAGPIAAISPDGSKALNYDFVRSNRGMSGYGYANGMDPAATGLVTALGMLGLLSLWQAQRLFHKFALAGEQPNAGI